MSGFRRHTALTASLTVTVKNVSAELTGFEWYLSIVGGDGWGHPHQAQVSLIKPQPELSQGPDGRGISSF